MNAKTLKALRGSIRKWEHIKAGTEVDLGASNCPLCRLFHKHFNETRICCHGCPVMKRTGLPQCRSTPYVNYINTCNPAEEKRYASKELVFLKSLLPKTKRHD